jgi:hypothetical protein
MPITMPRPTTKRQTLQPREHSVPCALCRKPTFNNNAVCDRHDLPTDAA